MSDKMKDLLVSVRHLVQQEYRRAEVKFGPVNHSSHESYAVILEEVTEALSAAKRTEDHLKEFWAAVMSDSDDDILKVRARWGLNCAIEMAAEAIQAAAMFYKAGLTANDYVRDTFTKWDLRDGHLVRTRDGSEYEYYNGAFYNEGRRYAWLSFYDEDLSCIEESIPAGDRAAWDIVCVYHYPTADRAGITGWTREGRPE